MGTQIVKHEHNIEVDGKIYRLRFSNRGLRDAEDFMGQSGEYIQSMLERGVVDQRLTTGLLFGATRKNHKEDLPSIEHIDDLMDDISDEYEDDETGEKMRNGFIIPLMAAYLRRPQKELRDMMASPEKEAKGEIVEGSETVKEAGKDETPKGGKVKAA